MITIALRRVVVGVAALAFTLAAGVFTGHSLTGDTTAAGSNANLACSGPVNSC